MAQQYKDDADTFDSFTEETGVTSKNLLKVLNEISNSIQAVALTMSESARGAQQIAVSTGETSKSLAEVKESSVKFSEIAGKLNNMLGN